MKKLSTPHGSAAALQSRSAGSTTGPSEDTSAYMSCEVCDLTGGPFPPQEAAYLRAIHDRVHHGISVAA